MKPRVLPSQGCRASPRICARSQRDICTKRLHLQPCTKNPHDGEAAVGVADFLRRAWGGFGKMTGTVLTRPQTPPETAAPPCSRLGRCPPPASSHNLHPCGFRGWLGHGQGLFHQTTFPQPLPRQLPRLIQTTTLAKCPCHARRAARWCAGREAMPRVGTAERPARKTPQAQLPSGQEK